MTSIKSLVLSLDVIHSAKNLFPNALSVLVLHLLSKINSRSASFLSLTKFIISSLNSSLFPYSVVKIFPPLSIQNSHLFIYIFFLYCILQLSERALLVVLQRTLFVVYQTNQRSCLQIRRSLPNSAPYPTLTNVFTLLNILLALIATLPAFLDIISG